MNLYRDPFRDVLHLDSIVYFICTLNALNVVQFKKIVVGIAVVV